MDIMDRINESLEMNHNNLQQCDEEISLPTITSADMAFTTKRNYTAVNSYDAVDCFA